MSSHTITHTRHAEIEPFTTKDGSQIRELLHPGVHAVVAQSFAEATIPVGARTLLHRHVRAEEVYHVTQGRGEMRLGESTFAIGPGDTVCIAPGTPHGVHNLGDRPLVILCACSPAYSHDDTELLE